MTSIPDRVNAAANALVNAAHIALADYGDAKQSEGDSRAVAVQHLSTDAVRAATARLSMEQKGAGFTDTDELNLAHLLIAELATRLVEEQAK